MAKSLFQVLIIEDDPYSSDLMLMLLSRDYRTQVAGELSNHVNLAIFDSPSNSLSNTKFCKDDIGDDYFDIDFNTIDVIILDAEVPWDNNLPIKIVEKISRWETPPKIICTCTIPNVEIFNELLNYDFFSGYLIKREVLYSIVSAVCLVYEDNFVITPGIVPLLEKKRGKRTLILNSLEMLKVKEGLNKIGREVIRLGLLFNLPDNEIQDELCISEAWVRGIIHKEYNNLHLLDIASNAISLDEAFDNPYINNQKIIQKYQETLKKMLEQKERRQEGRTNPKFRNMSTLAFHLLTRPEIKEWHQETAQLK